MRSSSFGVSSAKQSVQGGDGAHILQNGYISIAEYSYQRMLSFLPTSMCEPGNGSWTYGLLHLHNRYGQQNTDRSRSKCEQFEEIVESPYCLYINLQSSAIVVS